MLCVAYVQVEESRLLVARVVAEAMSQAMLPRDHLSPHQGYRQDNAHRQRCEQYQYNLLVRWPAQGADMGPKGTPNVPCTCFSILLIGSWKQGEKLKQEHPSNRKSPCRMIARKRGIRCMRYQQVNMVTDKRTRLEHKLFNEQVYAIRCRTSETNPNDC